MNIKISPLFFLMALALVFFGFWPEFVSYFAVIVIHEFAHAEASKRLGYSLSRMKLAPYGASLTGAFEGVKLRDEVLIALASPAVNLLLATFFISLWWLIPSTYFFTEVFVLSNIYTAAFNLIPIFPLDGGRALLAVLSKSVKREKAYRIMRVAGICFALGLSAACIFTLVKGINFSFAAVAVFMFISTIFPDKISKYQRLYSMAYRSEKLKSGLTVKEIMVGNDTTIIQMLRLLNGNYYHRFVIVDKTFKKIGEVDEIRLEALAAKHDNNISAATLLGIGENS